jgi:hypothetical protein
MYDIIRAAELRLAQRATVAHQIMEDIKAQYAPIVLNDDDWYIFDTITKELIAQRGSSLPAYAIAGITEPGQTALRGLAIKCRGIELWRSA